jgi:hypothetical protein
MQDRINTLKGTAKLLQEIKEEQRGEIRALHNLNAMKHWRTAHTRTRTRTQGGSERGIPKKLAAPDVLVE